MFDLDRSTSIGTGDFALFSACFGECHAAGNPCLDSNFDGDLAGCVGTSDFAAFSNCFGSLCGECSGCSGPAGGAAGSAGGVASSATLVSVHAVVVARPSAPDAVSALPDSLPTLDVGEHAYVEVWATRPAAIETDARGLAAVFVDLSYNENSASISRIEPGASFPMFANRAAIAGGGLARRIGGCARIGDRTVGAEGAWVRVATLPLRAEAPGLLRVRLSPSEPPLGVSIVGDFSDVRPTSIDFAGADVLINGKADQPARSRAAAR